MKIQLLAPIVLFSHFLSAGAAAESTLHDTDRYLYSAATGWIDGKPSMEDGVVFGEYTCSGYAYSSNIGWIHFGNGTPANGIHYQNDSAADFGVNHDQQGNLSGYAYGANIGWINFSWAPPLDSQRPRVDLLTGEFQGYAYGANVGWIHLETGHFKTVTMRCLDTDQDSMSDAWEREHFGSLNVADATTDSDGDTRADVIEYLDQTDPNDPKSTLNILSHSLNPAGTELTLTFTTSPTRLYIIETSDTLGPLWNKISPGLFKPDQGNQTTKLMSFPPDTRRIFVRIRPQKPFSIPK